MKRVHLIAVGGAIMHNLAIALQNRGYKITGSDDAIYDPAKANLAKVGLLPPAGWDSNNITSDIDVIILGMHAKQDNPELIKAKKLGLTIMSFPEFVAKECSNKKRIVVAGSHGKTTTTAMIMHVLSKLNIDFDYLVGSSIDGFDLSVRLTDAPLVIIEGDEYLSSPLDLRSKFLWYNPHISIITGIAYDHINVFPTFDLYIDTFDKYIKTHTENSQYFWFQKDEYLSKLSENNIIKNTPYDTPQYRNTADGTIITQDFKKYKLSIIGKHNLENLKAAQLVCEQLDISTEDFYKAAEGFTGAGRRMEKIVDNGIQVVFRDFAHSPSKLQATTEAISETYSGQLLAVFELHTFSSLNKDFLPLYKDTTKSADQTIVFYDTAVFKHKNMEIIPPSYIKECFGDITVISNKEELALYVNELFSKGWNISLMSSGTFQNAEFSFS